MSKRTDEIFQQAIQELGIDVPIFRVVADMNSLTFHLYGGQVKTWHPEPAPTDAHTERAPADLLTLIAPSPVPATSREVQDCDGIGKVTAESLARHGIFTIRDLVNTYHDGTLATYLPAATLRKAETWLAKHGYLPPF
jgi:hypothetical protein